MSLNPSPFSEDARRRVEKARAKAVDALNAERNAGGWWEGELSASALSTATAVTALILVARREPEQAGELNALAGRGLRWLAAHQNADGGWGDTILSKSNISTTTLVWAACGLAPEAVPGNTLEAVERWLRGAAGSLEPDALVRAIELRYGKDRTFSIPILTMCALCGRLGPGEEGWRRVRQLPFEVAVLPQRWFGAMQLPVVSYALPALIAIGQVRHGLRPTSNPVLRAVRDRCRERTLAKLAELQPANGGFLEATPLTSFVTMSLAGLGWTQHSVVRRGVDFIKASVRADGSWPIDTNLATWLSTLAGGALGRSEDGAGRALGEWLLGQQHRRIHPFTLAAPGGWSWTNLPGGVPDADDTAGALLALRTCGLETERTREAGRAGVEWLLGLQNRDGGIPTFCRGWGRLPFDRSSPDLTAHAMRAWTVWREEMPETVRRRIAGALGRAETFLQKAQRENGSWVPLWFGNQDAENDENPLYGTARVVLALCETERGKSGRVEEMLARGVRWLLGHQQTEGGWSGASAGAASVEETAVALEALAAAWGRVELRAGEEDALRMALERGAAKLVAAVEEERWREAAPIGFYFAKLWYFERLYPLIFATAALGRLAALR